MVGVADTLARKQPAFKRGSPAMLPLSYGAAETSGAEKARMANKRAPTSLSGSFDRHRSRLPGGVLPRAGKASADLQEQRFQQCEFFRAQIGSEIFFCRL